MRTKKMYTRTSKSIAEGIEVVSTLEMNYIRGGVSDVAPWPIDD